MSVIGLSDKDKVIAVAEDGTSVTAAMVSGWCEAYDKGELPDGYEVDGPATRGRPPLHGERMSTITIRIPVAQKTALEDEAHARGLTTSEYVRGVLDARIA